LISLFDDFPSIEHVEAAAEAYQQSPFVEVWQKGDLAKMNEALMEQSVKLRNFALQIAFPGAREQERARVSELLGERGFGSLFESEAELFELARLTLHFGGAGTAIKEVAQRLERPSEEVETCLRSFNDKSQASLGVDLFEIEAGSATSAV
jgi:hypothetical protein